MKDEIVEIFAGEFYQASMIKDVLDAIGIEAFIENGLIGNIATWYASSGGVTCLNVRIFSSDDAVAKKLIVKFRKGDEQFLRRKNGSMTFRMGNIN